MLKPVSFLACALTIAVFFAAPASAASTSSFHLSRVNGRYHLNGSVYATGINITAFATTVSGKTIYGGQILIIKDNATILRAPVNGMHLNNNSAPTRAVLTSSNFSYKGTPARLTVILDTTVKNGSVGFHVNRADNGAELTSSLMNGSYATPALEWGAIALR